MEGYRRRPPIGVAELLVGSALANFDESESNQYRYNFPGFEDRDAGHSVDQYSLRADELGLQLGRTILKKHPDHLSKVRMKLVERRALAMSTREPWNVADVQLRVRAVLDDGGVGVHGADCSASAGGRSDDWVLRGEVGSASKWGTSEVPPSLWVVLLLHFRIRQQACPK